MKFRKILMCGVAAGALGLAAAMPDGTLPNLTAPAAAQSVSVSIGFGTFYDRLSPHGDWVMYEGRHVWVPTSVDAQWRPYTVGRWVYTAPYGWTWVSDEPFSWAVYHYGRWGFTHNIGWYWVPDTQWAPAWVSWRTSGDHVAWAPMPPSGAVQITYETDPLIIPARYWVAVPTNRFLAPNIFTVALHPWEPRFYDVVHYTRPAGHVTIVENQVINNVINVNYIEEVTGEEVNIRQVNFTEQETTTDADGETVALFAPTVEEEPEAEPQEVKTVEEVSERREAAAAPETSEEIEAQLDEPVDVAQDAPEAPEEAVVEQPKPVTDEDVAEETPGEGEQPAADVTEETPAEGEEPAADVAEEAPGEGEQPEGEVTEETPAEGEEPAADVAEEPAPEGQPEEEVVEEEPTTPEPPAAAAPEAQPEEEVVEEEPTTPEPPAAAAPQAQPEADVSADEPDQGVGERAIGEPEEAGEPAAAEEAPGQQRKLEEEEEKQKD